MHLTSFILFLFFLNFINYVIIVLITNVYFNCLCVIIVDWQRYKKAYNKIPRRFFYSRRIVSCYPVILTDAAAFCFIGVIIVVRIIHSCHNATSKSRKQRAIFTNASALLLYCDVATLFASCVQSRLTAILMQKSTALPRSRNRHRPDAGVPAR